MPACDPWRILGIPPGSDPDEIRRAFRRLALRHHPDLHGGDKEAERRFREIADAYRRLQETTDTPPSPDPGGLLGRIGRGAGLAAGAIGRTLSPSQGVAFTVTMTLAEAFTGCTRAFLLERRGRDGGPALASRILLPVPRGSREGDRLRFTWRGGEAVATIGRLADPLLTLTGNDLLADVPVPLPLALAGGTIPVPGLPGPATLDFSPIDTPAVLYRRPGAGWPRREGGRGEARFLLRVEHPMGDGSDIDDPARYPAHRDYLGLLAGRGAGAAVPR